MICPACVERTHFACEYPLSCSCAHKRTWPDGETDKWTYKALPVTFDGGRHGWMWQASHPDSDKALWFDRRGRKCEPRPGKTGIRLFYRAVDFGTIIW